MRIAFKAPTKTDNAISRANSVDIEGTARGLDTCLSYNRIIPLKMTVRITPEYRKLRSPHAIRSLAITISVPLLRVIIEKWCI